jgi:hypothetical protein
MISCTSTARREVPAGSGDNHRADVGDIGEGPERFRELAVRVERQRIFPVRPVQRDRGDAARDVPAKVAWADGGDVDADWGHDMVVKVVVRVYLAPASPRRVPACQDHCCFRRSTSRSSCCFPDRYCQGHHWSA